MKSSFLEYSRFCVIASCFALIIIFSVNSLVFDPEFLLALWLVKVLPIAAFIPSLFKRNLRAYQWLCFVILLYFTQGVLESFAPERLIQGVLISFFCILLFSSAIYFVHGSHKE